MKLYFDPSNNSQIKWNKDTKMFICNFSKMYGINNFKDLPKFLVVENIVTENKITFKLFSKKFDNNNQPIKCTYISTSGANYNVDLEIFNN